MDGGTTFHFVTDGAEAALKRAHAAAGGRDIRIGGGASTLRQYLAMRAVDEMHLAQSPVIMGSGESVIEGLDLASLGYEVSDRVCGERAVHYTVTKRA